MCTRECAHCQLPLTEHKCSLTASEDYSTYAADTDCRVLIVQRRNKFLDGSLDFTVKLSANQLQRILIQHSLKLMESAAGLELTCICDCWEKESFF